jgi:hypothetical protein
MLVASWLALALYFVEDRPVNLQMLRDVVRASPAFPIDPSSLPFRSAVRTFEEIPVALSTAALAVFRMH